jgi:ANTAR domain
VIPGPRPSTGQKRPDVARGTVRAALLPAPEAPVTHNRRVQPSAEDGTGGSPVSLTRTPRGWRVVSPAGTHEADGLVEGLSLADLIAEEFGALAEPDRLTRRSARGTVEAVGDDADPVEARIAALERTVAQLEHALAARVATERAIGVLAERFGTDPRAAFETLRRDARSSGRPVADIAREVLDAMVPRDDAAPAPVSIVPPVPRLPELSGPPTVPLTVDGRS